MVASAWDQSRDNQHAGRTALERQDTDDATTAAWALALRRLRLLPSLRTRLHALLMKSSDPHGARAHARLLEEDLEWVRRGLGQRNVLVGSGRAQACVRSTRSPTRAAAEFARREWARPLMTNPTLPCASFASECGRTCWHSWADRRAAREAEREGRAKGLGEATEGT